MDILVSKTKEHDYIYCEKEIDLDNSYEKETDGYTG